MDHLDTIELRLSNERVRLANAKTDQERELRAVWVRGIEKELSDEKAFLGITDLPTMSDDEILAALAAQPHQFRSGEDRRN